MAACVCEEINPAEDSLRLYHLHASFRDEGMVERFGRDTAIDFEGPKGRGLRPCSR